MVAEVQRQTRSRGSTSSAMLQTPSPSQPVGLESRPTPVELFPVTPGERADVTGCIEQVNRKLDLKSSKAMPDNRILDLRPTDQVQLELLELSCCPAPPTTGMPDTCGLLELTGTQGPRVIMRSHPLGFEEATMRSQSPPSTAALSRSVPLPTRTVVSDKCVLLELKGTHGARVMLR